MATNVKKSYILKVCKKNLFRYYIYILFLFVMGCIEHTLIPGQIIQQSQMSYVNPPSHKELLRGGLLEQKIASKKLADRMKFVAFYPLHLIAIGNFIEEGESEKIFSSEKKTIKNSVTAKSREEHKVKGMLDSKDDQQREIGVGLQNITNNEKMFAASFFNEDSYVRLASVHLLKNYSFDVIAPYIMLLLNDSNEFVRLEVVRQLAYFQTKEVLYFVYKALVDVDPLVRGEAVMTTMNLGFIDSVPRLWSMLDDSEMYVCSKTVLALETLTNTTVKYPCDGNEDIRRQKIVEWKKWWYQKQGIFDNGK